VSVPEGNSTASSPTDSAAGNQPRRPAGESPFYRQLVMTAMGLLILVLLVYLLREFAAIIQQLLVAAFVAYLILPAHRWLLAHRVPAVVSFVLVALGVLVVFWLLGALIVNSVDDLNSKLPQYQRNIATMVERWTERFPQIDAELIGHVIGGDTTAFDLGVQWIRTALSAIYGLISQAVIVLIYLLFILGEQSGFRRRIEQAFKPEQAERTLSVLYSINHSIERYIAIKTALSLLTGVLTTVIVALFGVDYALLWGLMAFLLNFIPYLGSVVATLLPVLLSLVQLQSPLTSLMLLICLAVAQNGIAYLVEPVFTGKQLNLSPLVVLFALAFWGGLWGAVGMILAVPLVAVLKAILENIDETRPIARLMSHA
jgi:AI-2 transport protein TqsA